MRRRKINYEKKRAETVEFVAPLCPAFVALLRSPEIFISKLYHSRIMNILKKFYYLASEEETRRSKKSGSALGGFLLRFFFGAVHLINLIIIYFISIKLNYGSIGDKERTGKKNFRPEKPVTNGFSACLVRID